MKAPNFERVLGTVLGDYELSIPGHMRRLVADFADASAVYSAARDASGEGSSTFPNGVLVGHHQRWVISYNGRIWANANHCVYPAVQS